MSGDSRVSRTSARIAARTAQPPRPVAEVELGMADVAAPR